MRRPRGQTDRPTARSPRYVKSPTATRPLYRFSGKGLTAFFEFFKIWHAACVLSLAHNRVVSGYEIGGQIQNRPIAFLEKELVMLHWALVFLLIALVAGVFGFSSLYVAAAGIAKILFFIFIVLFLVSLISGGISRRGI